MDNYIWKGSKTMDLEYSLLSGALTVFHDFCGNHSPIEFTYDFQAKEFEELKEKYKIQEIAGNGSEIEKVINLLQWCNQNVLHNGGTKDVEFIPKTSLAILDYSFGKGREYGVYCRLQAIVLTECCLALGIKSRILHCLPYSPYDFESHVVSMVYINELNKWILVDPTNNRYFLDENNTILSPLEARERLGKNLFIKCNMEDDSYKKYMAKNMFYFKSLQHNTFGSDILPNQNTIYCVPNGLDVLGREVAYCKYAIENSPEHLKEDWKKHLDEFIKKTHFINSSSNNFFA